MRIQPISGALAGVLCIGALLASAKAQTLDTIQLSSTLYSVVENAGTAAIEIQRTGPMTDFATVTLETISNTAGANDFQPLSQTISFDPGQSNVTVLLQILNDALPEDWEHLEIVLSDADPFCCQLGENDRATVQIQDNDDGVQFDPGYFSVLENAGTLQIGVSRFGDMTNAAGSIAFQISQNGATNGVHYVLATNRVSFAAGQTHATITVLLVNNAVPEGPKNFVLNFEPNPNPSCCSAGVVRSAQVWILDNDFGIQFSNWTFFVPEESGVPVIELVRGGDFVAVECSVNIGILDQNASNGVDYSLDATNFTFAPGQSNVIVPLLIHNDASREQTEAFQLQLIDDPSNCPLDTETPSSATIYIVDNDPGIDFVQPLYTAIEGNPSVTVHLRRLSDNTNEFTVDLMLGGSAVPGTDFILPANRLHFAAGQTNLALVIPLLDDPFVEGMELIRLFLTNATAGVDLGGNTGCTVELSDNEHPVNMVDLVFGSLWYSTLIAALAQPDGKLVVAPPVHRFNPDGTEDPSFTPFSPGTIYDLQLDSDGSIIVAGSFSWIAGGVLRNSLARLRTNGVPDESFAPALSEVVRAVRIQPDGKLLIAGAFNLQGTLRSIARLTRTGAWDPSFTADVYEPRIVSMAIQPDGKVVIAGGFSSVNARACHGIARLQSDGSLDDFFNAGLSENTFVTALALQSDGNLLAVISSNRVVRLSGLDGAVDPSFTPPLGSNSVILNMTLQPDGKVLLIGDILGLDHNRLGAIVRLNTDGSLDSSFSSAVGSGFVLWAGGDIFTAEFGRVIRLLRETPANSFWLSTNRYHALESGTNASVTILRGGNSSAALSVELAIGGDAIPGLDFVAVPGRVGFQPLETAKQILFPLIDDCRDETNETVLIALTNASSGADLSGPDQARLWFIDDEAPGSLDSFNPTLDWLTFETNYFYGDQTAMALQSDGRILIGRKGIMARVHRDGTQDHSFMHGESVCATDFFGFGSCNISALLIQPDGTILAGGYGSLIRLYPDGRRDTDVFAAFRAFGDHGREFPGVVTSLISQSDGKILVCGAFHQINGRFSPGLARLNSDITIDESFSVNVNVREISAVKVLPDGKLLTANWVVFRFFSSRSWLARLNADGSVDTNFTSVEVGSFTRINAIALLPDEKVLIGGSFSSGLARLNADGSLDTNFNPAIIAQGSMLTSVDALAIGEEGGIFAGGQFDDGMSRLVKLDAGGAVVPAFNDGLRFNGQITSIIEQPDGELLVSGSFNEVSSIPRPGIARLKSSRSHIQLSPPLEADGSLRIVSGSHAGQTYVLQRSSDLQIWTAVATNTAVDCVVEFTDPSPSAEAGFYRVIKTTE